MRTRENWFVAIDQPGPPRRMLRNSSRQAHDLAKGLRRLSKRARVRVVHRTVRTYSAVESAKRQAVIAAATTYRNAVQANLVPTELGNGLVVDTFARLAAAVAALES